MPMVENIIVEGTVRAPSLRVLWGTFGRQVRVMGLELGGGMGVEEVGAINQACPALEEINLRIDVPSLDDYGPVNRFMHWVFYACEHDALQRLGVCVDLDVRE